MQSRASAVLHMQLAGANQCLTVLTSAYWCGVQGEVSVGMRAGAGRCTGDANIRSPLQNVLCPPHPLPPLFTSDAVIILIADCHHGDHGHRVFSYHLTANQMSI